MVRKVLVLRLLVFCGEKDGNYALQMGRSGLAGIDVEKSSSHHLSQTEIGVIIPVLDTYPASLIFCFWPSRLPKDSTRSRGRRFFFRGF